MTLFLFSLQTDFGGGMSAIAVFPTSITLCGTDGSKCPQFGLQGNFYCGWAGNDIGADGERNRWLSDLFVQLAQLVANQLGAFQ